MFYMCVTSFFLIFLLGDILSEGRLDVEEKLSYLQLNSLSIKSGRIVRRFYDLLSPKDLIETRPTFPSDRKTYNLAHIARGNLIRHLEMGFRPNKDFSLSVQFEDSKRDFLNSQIKEQTFSHNFVV